MNYIDTFIMLLGNTALWKEFDSKRRIYFIVSLWTMILFTTIGPFKGMISFSRRGFKGKRIIILTTMKESKNTYERILIITISSYCLIDFYPTYFTAMLGIHRQFHCCIGFFLHAEECSKLKRPRSTYCGLTDI